jgi:gliding motility-associated-like protein
MPFVALATARAEVTVYNAVSPNGDRSNDYLRIENIENYFPNKFSLFNRWGDKMFEIENYDNDERAFRERSNLYGDRELETGTYFYVLVLPEGESLRGYIAVKK